MYEIGKLVGERRATDKFPEAKKAAVQRSRSVLSGMFAEQLAPYLPNFPFSPTEAKFIGAPIDFLVFKGMDAQCIEEVIFAEVKSGSARLNRNEHSLKDAIDNKRVRWHEYHVPAGLTHASVAGSAASDQAWCPQGLSSPATIPNLFRLKPCTQIRQAKAPDLMFT